MPSRSEASLPVSHVPETGDRAEQSPDVQQEVDLWWSGYAGRAMWPSFTIAGLAVIAIIGVTAYGARQGMDSLTMRYTAYVLLALVTGVQIGIWLFRLATWNYRLTTRRLLIERTFINKRFEPIELAHIKHVELMQTPFERMVGVGNLRLVVEQGSEIILVGVAAPQRVTALIRDLVEQSKRGGPITAPEAPAGDRPVAAGHMEGEV
jgi:membrane protein YdbS with pleckstrin-like domain